MFAAAGSPVAREASGVTLRWALSLARSGSTLGLGEAVPERGRAQILKVHLVNPSDTAFGTAVITPRWLFVLAAATPSIYGDPEICDETLRSLNAADIAPGDVVGIGIHTGNALRGYALGKMARERGATVIFGGIHATLYPEETLEMGNAHAAVKGDGDLIWAEVLKDCARGTPKKIYDGGRVASEHLSEARWDLLPQNSYMWASVRPSRGCPKHCSFCSVWRTDGQNPAAPVRHRDP